MELIIFLIVSFVMLCYDIYRSYDDDYIPKNAKNYCSFFPEGSWGDCCYDHDTNCLLALEYLSWNMRLYADIKLYDCVYKKNKMIAHIMYIGVRFWAYTFWWIGYWREKNGQKTTVVPKG